MLNHCVPSYDVLRKISLLFHYIAHSHFYLLILLYDVKLDEIITGRTRYNAYNMNFAWHLLAVENQSHLAVLVSIFLYLWLVY